MRVVVEHKAIVFQKLKVAVAAVAKEDLFAWSVPPAGHQAVHSSGLVVVPVAAFILLGKGGRHPALFVWPDTFRIGSDQALISSAMMRRYRGAGMPVRLLRNFLVLPT